MIIDGNTLAQQLLQELKNEISHQSARPHLTVISCAPTFVTQKYLSLKLSQAQAVGIETNIITLPATITTKEYLKVIERVQMQTDAIVVQLPLPPSIDANIVIAAIPPAYDADAMHYRGSDRELLPPVVAAIVEISTRYAVSFLQKRVLVVGHGRLVGKPAALYAAAQGSVVTVATKETADLPALLSVADIVISGVGVPCLIEARHLKVGVALFDAGTAEDGGEIKGDVHPDCALKASLFTPVPGGIGPLTIVMLLRNVLALTK